MKFKYIYLSLFLLLLTALAACDVFSNNPGGVVIQAVDIATAKSQYRITPNGDPIDGFTSSFSAADSMVVDIGISNILGYTLSK